MRPGDSWKMLPEDETFGLTLLWELPEAKLKAILPADQQPRIRDGKGVVMLFLASTTAPTMIYFGQEVGEPGAEMAGFGQPSRTSMFDYIGVPQHQKWVNGGKFDGGQLSDNEKALRNYYSEVLNFTRTSSALMGEYLDLHTFNRKLNPAYTDKTFAFARWDAKQKLLVVTNFDEHQSVNTDLHLSPELLKAWNLKLGTRELKERMFGKKNTQLRVDKKGAHIELILGPWESAVFEVK
jgi:hypothetical protein